MNWRDCVFPAAWLGLWGGLYSITGLAEPVGALGWFHWIRGLFPPVAALGAYLLMPCRPRVPVFMQLLLGYGIATMIGAATSGAPTVAWLLAFSYVAAILLSAHVQAAARPVMWITLGLLWVLTSMALATQMWQAWQVCGVPVCFRARLAADLPGLPIRPNATGRIAGLAGLISLALLGRRHRAIGFALLALGVFVMYVAHSRTSLVAVVGATLLVLLVQRTTFVKAFLPAIGVAAAVALGFVLSPSRHLSKTIETGHITNLNRTTAWERALDIIASRPWFGHGMGAEHAGLWGDSAFVHAAIQGGLVGAALFCLAWLVLAWGVVRTLRLGLARDAPRLAAAIGVLSFTGVSGITANSSATFSFDLILMCVAGLWLQWESQAIERRVVGAQDTFELLGQSIEATDVAGAIRAVHASKGPVCLVNVNMLVQAQKDAIVREAVSGATLRLPDGAPITAAGQRLGMPVGRVRGVDLVRALASDRSGSMYLYGGAPGIAELMGNELSGSYGVHIAGTESPPFRELDEAELDEVAHRIQATGARIVLVGLGCPKQEIWMHRMKDRLPDQCLIGVGAAFDFLAGSVPESPRWIVGLRLEWAWRLLRQPSKSLPRVLFEGPRFYWSVFWSRSTVFFRRPPGDVQPGGPAT